MRKARAHGLWAAGAAILQAAACTGRLDVGQIRDDDGGEATLEAGADGQGGQSVSCPSGECALASSSGGAASSSGSGSSSGSSSSADASTSSGSSSSSGSSGGYAPSDAGFDVTPAPSGLAGFAFVVNGVEQAPLSCPSESWEYPPPAAQLAASGDDGSSHHDFLCGDALIPQPPCVGLRVFLVNTGQYPVAYTAQTTWSGYQPPGVPFGNANELSGVLNPGASVDITSVYVGGYVAVLGSSHPFLDPDAGKYAADGTTIAWPAGVAGSGGATQMYVAALEIEDSCRNPAIAWP